MDEIKMDELEQWMQLLRTLTRKQRARLLRQGVTLSGANLWETKPSPAKGVYWNGPHKAWQVNAYVNGSRRMVHAGFYKDVEEAKAVATLIRFYKPNSKVGLDEILAAYDHITPFGQKYVDKFKGLLEDAGVI